MGRIPVYYTFGNHMHWVDMQWLWGQEVLPGSVDDMLVFCAETGAKGNVNFDGIGYEKLAAENPPAFARLRAAVEAGIIEVVGGSYGQPYGLFHGGESNVRQRIYGARTVERLFGKRARTFWEEEFDFFPQLPQILAGAGFDGGSLFFQWTWHTPHVPFDDSPVVRWEAPDGTPLLCATRNRLNVHQWPEDFDGLLDQVTGGGEVPPLILQWLELMPSPDWMCRSEVLLPRMRELLADERFEIRMTTLGKYLELWREREVPTRRYAMGEVFHGMSLGKNGDEMRRLSARAEDSVLTGEAIASVASLFGRPYAQWDVYPFWELEEAWREVLQAQHHDNDECEGLCGHIGRFSYARAESLANHVVERCLARLAREAAGEPGYLFFNPLGWTRSDTCIHDQKGGPVVARDVPAFGFRFVPEREVERKQKPWKVEGSRAAGSIGELRVEVDASTGHVHFASPEWPDGVWSNPILRLSCEGYEGAFEPQWVNVDSLPGDLVVGLRPPQGGEAQAWLKLPSDCRALDLTLKFWRLPPPAPGMTKGIELQLELPAFDRLFADTPYLVEAAAPGGEFVRKYPEGDWMTSPQWFETVSGGFTALSLVDVEAGSHGLLIAQDRTRQWFVRDNTLVCLLSMYDPWDEDYFVSDFDASFRFVPHGGVDAAQKWRWAQEFLRPMVFARVREGKSERATGEFGLLACEPNGVQVTALYREAAGAGMEHPFVLRLVEMNGEPTHARLRFSASVTRAVRTNLLGDPLEELAVSPGSLSLPMKAHEIATIYVVLEEGKKVTRDLDSRREVWATVHRV
jgi:alpha-mannosidase